MSSAIVVAGAGYVGLAMSVLLARRHHVVCYDVDEGKVAQLNAGHSPIEDPLIRDYLTDEVLDLTFTTDPADVYRDADIVVIATPTDYDHETNSFDTASVSQEVRRALEASSTSTIVIKSTVPVGYTSSLQQEHDTDRVLFAPEFLREGRALYDNLHPSRIVVGGSAERAQPFATIMSSLALDDDVPVRFMTATEAESVKLFSNTYLAMRVAFFNELDSFAIAHDLDAGRVVDGVCLDPRIGHGHNNPSFGYGGYCLPKDTRQLLSNYRSIPQSLISAIVDTNARRMDFITGDIMARRPSRVGVYRLSMKAGSDNFRESSVFGVMERLAAHGVDLQIYEPAVEGDDYLGTPVLHDLSTFIDTSDLIIANRRSDELAGHGDKVYSRDLFNVN